MANVVEPRRVASDRDPAAAEKIEPQAVSLEAAQGEEQSMVKLVHLNLSVSNYPNSRDWYVRHVGLKVEFENLDAGVGGLSGDGEVELILTQGKLPPRERDCVFTFQCDSVQGKYDE